MAPPTPQSSQSLREAGNELFWQAKFDDAVDSYLSAINHTPNDAAAFRNLSSALFELGNYTGCIKAIDMALSMDPDVKKKPALVIRRAKCLIYLGDPEAAKETLRGQHTQVAVAIYAAATRYAEIGVPSEDAKLCTYAEIAAMPWARPAYRTFFEMFAKGHDNAVAAVRVEQLVRREMAGQPIDLLVLYGGCGDARHFYQQLHHLFVFSHAEGDKKWGDGDSYHLGIQDINPRIMAQNLIILKLLHDHASAVERDRKLMLMLPNCI